MTTPIRSLVSLAAYLPSQAIPTAMNIVTLGVLSRLLGSRGTGALLLWTSVGTFSALLLGNWFQQSLLRFTAGRWEPEQAELRRIVARFLSASALAALIGLAITVPAALALAVSPMPAVVVVAFAGLEVLFRTLLAVAQCQERVALYNAASAGHALLRAGCSVAGAVLFAPYGAFGALAGVVAAHAAVSLFLIWHLVGYRPFLHLLRGWDAFGATLRTYFVYGAPLLAFLLLSELRPLADRILLTRWLGLEAAGLFASNFLLGSSAIGFVGLPLLLRANPALMRAANRMGNRASFERRSEIFYALYLVASLSVAVCLIPNSALVSRLVLGNTFLPGHAMVAAGVLAGLISGAAIYAGKPLEVQRETVQLLSANAVAFFLGLGVSLALLPVMGFTAMGVGGVASALFYLALVSKFAAQTGRLRAPARLIVGCIGVAGLLCVLPASDITPPAGLAVSAVVLAGIMLLAAGARRRWRRHLIVALAQ